eukprot:gene4506-4759_t
MWMLITLLLVATVKLDGYLKLRGVLCTIQRLQAALGLLFACYPSCDLWCPWLWRHRLLVVHMVSTLARVPARSLLLGGLPVWLVATLIDASGLQDDCGQSVTCLYRSFTVLMAKVADGDPLSTAQHIISAICSSSSATHLACLLFPTLLAAYLEAKARKAWSAREEETPASVDSPTDEHAVSVCVPAPAQQPSTGQTSSAALLGASGKQQLQNPLLQDPQCPGTPAVVAPVQKPRIPRARAVATQAQPQRIPQLSVNPRIQQRLNNGRPWYVSPVVSKLVQFSLQQPPNASTEDYIAVKQQLKAAVLSHYSSGSSEGASDASSSGNSSVHSCQIAECTSFRGSWNLVIRAVLARRAVVQRLLQSGSSVLRVVIAQQPQGHVLLDESWALHSWNQQQLAGVDEAEGQAGVGTRAQVLSVLILTDTALAAGTAGAAAATNTPVEDPPSTARRATRIIAQLPLL